MSTPIKRPNGKKQPTRAECPHADLCVSGRQHEVVMASLDAISEQMHRLTMSLAEVRERVTVTAQREEQWVGVLSKVERSLRVLVPQE